MGTTAPTAASTAFEYFLRYFWRNSSASDFSWNKVLRFYLLFYQRFIVLKANETIQNMLSELEVDCCRLVVPNACLKQFECHPTSILIT